MWGTLAGVVIGLLVGYTVRLFEEHENEAVLSARSQMKVAFHEAARLARRIHQQRLVIKELMAENPKPKNPKKMAVVAK